MDKNYYIKKYLNQRVQMLAGFYKGELGEIETVEYPSKDYKANNGFKLYIRLQSASLIISYDVNDLSLLKPVSAPSSI